MSSFISIAAIAYMTFVACGIDASAGTPCTKHQRYLPPEQTARLQSLVSKQLDIPSISVLATFAFDTWLVLYIDTHRSDEVFLFYPADPSTVSYSTMWSGAASRAESKAIESWALTNAKGIPRPLAQCFAWYATAGR